MVRVEIKRSKHMHREAVDIDFENMIVHIKKTSFNIYRDRDNENTWLFSPSSNRSGLKALSEDASEAIEKAYVQWTLEHTILGADA